MRAEKLVEACQTSTEEMDLAYALAKTMHPARLLPILFQAALDKDDPQDDPQGVYDLERAIGVLLGDLHNWRKCQEKREIEASQALITPLEDPYLQGPDFGDQ